MKPYAYVKALGFTSLTVLPVKKPSLLAAFRYGAMDIRTLRTILGKPKHIDGSTGKHIFMIAKDKVIRVDTDKKTVLLGNGEHATKIIIASVVGANSNSHS